MTGEHLGCFQLLLLLLLLWYLYEYSSMCFLVYRLRIYYVYVVVNIVLFLTFKNIRFHMGTVVSIVPKSRVLNYKTSCPSGYTIYLSTGRTRISLAPYLCQHLILSYFYIFAHMVHVELFHCYFNLYFTS